jgi:hypothetical protein
MTELPIDAEIRPNDTLQNVTIGRELEILYQSNAELTKENNQLRLRIIELHKEMNQMTLSKNSDILEI